MKIWFQGTSLRTDSVSGKLYLEATNDHRRAPSIVSPRLYKIA